MTTLRISALREQRLLMTKSSIAQPQKMVVQILWILLPEKQKVLTCDCPKVKLNELGYGISIKDRALPWALPREALREALLLSCSHSPSQVLSLNH